MSYLYFRSAVINKLKPSTPEEEKLFILGEGMTLQAFNAPTLKGGDI